MTGLRIVAGVLLALLLLSFVRLGGEVEYSGEGLLVKARIGFLRLQVFPLRKKKKEKAQKPKKEKAVAPQPETLWPTDTQIWLWVCFGP